MIKIASFTLLLIFLNKQVFSAQACSNANVKSVKEIRNAMKKKLGSGDLRDTYEYEKSLKKTVDNSFLEFDRSLRVLRDKGSKTSETLAAKNKLIELITDGKSLGALSLEAERLHAITDPTKEQTLRKERIRMRLVDLNKLLGGITQKEKDSIAGSSTQGKDREEIAAAVAEAYSWSLKEGTYAERQGEKVKQYERALTEWRKDETPPTRTARKKPSIRTDRFDRDNPAIKPKPTSSNRTSSSSSMNYGNYSMRPAPVRAPASFLPNSIIIKRGTGFNIPTWSFGNQFTPNIPMNPYFQNQGYQRFNNFQFGDYGQSVPSYFNQGNPYGLPFVY